MTKKELLNELKSTLECEKNNIKNLDETSSDYDINLGWIEGLEYAISQVKQLK
tara:strand:+ start:387 stop:545 length:159 start_codon:yes stop_codon:yes gene_type:complete